ncbi:hypothetical protein [Tenacibaculum aestuarii]|uniref:hypothetical protein n=1 Tax=Tenacibaculum aestuarii TaxID=362781 RepID=UPI00389561FE
MISKLKHSRDDKVALDFWENYYDNLQSTDDVDLFESEEDIEARKKELEADFEKWKQYYFDKYCTAETPDFHKASSNRVLNNPEWYEVRAWSRELSKTGLTMMEMTYLHLTGKKKFTFMISATKEAAIRLLRPYKLSFERNRRLIHDYGKQVTLGNWTEESFVTQSGGMFIALGAGQSPRGARNEEIRPDSAILDDFDTDEDCRNPDRVDKKWEWFEQAVYGARSISNPFLVIFNGNIIADYCCIKKAIAIADKHTIINIRDKKGKSTWSKNTEAHIDRVLSKISSASAQKEYFNNPVVLGKVFKKLHYGKMQPLQRYKYLIGYTDPSYKKNADYKATALIGKYKDEYHVLWVRCRQTTTRAMIDWQFELLDFVNDKTAVYLLIEWPWIDDTIKREIKAANKRHNQTLKLKADERTKPDKFYRIESNLEPLNSNGKLIFNEKLEGTDDMKAMEFQFLGLSAKSRINDDGPDAVEGGVFCVNHKNKQNTAPPQTYAKPTNSKRY